MGKQRFLAGILAVVLLITAIPHLATMGWKVRAEGTGSDVTATEGIKEVTMSTGYTGDRSNTKFSMRLTFALKDCNQELETQEEVQQSRGVVAGDYITYTFPDTVEVEPVADASIETDGGIQIATYNITSNVLTITFTDEIHTMFTGVSGGIDMNLSLNPEVLKDESAHEVVLTPDGFANAVKITIPAVPKTIDGVSLTNSGMNAKNEITWTESVGTADASKGASLKGVKVTNTIDTTYQQWKSLTVKGGNDDGSDLVIDLSSVTDASYTYTFPAGTKVVGPANLSYVTTVKSDAYATTDGTEKVEMSTALSAEAAEKVGANKSANSSVKLPKAELTKNGEQLNGNTLRWKMKLNANKANVYQAVVTDPLASGLSVTDAGITITSSSGKSFTLTKDIPTATDGDGTIKYELTGTDPQTVTLTFDKIHETYNITFDTKISHSMANDSTVNNTASLQVSYPQGDGGTGLTLWGKPSIDVEYTTAYLKVASTGVDKTTGTLSWQIQPSTKSTDYTDATLTWIIPDDQEYKDGTIGVKVGSTVYKKGSSEYDSYVKASTISGQNMSVTLNREQLKDAGVGLGDISIVYDTKALEYFKNDENHEYFIGKNPVKLEVDSFKIEQNTSVELQNQMLTSAVSSKYDDTKNEGSLHLVLTLDQNKMKLNHVNIVDDFADALFYKDDQTPETKLDKSDYKVTVSNGSVDANQKWTVGLASISDKTELTADITLTESGKEKLKLGKNLSGATIYLKNNASMTFDGILSEAFTTSVTGSGAGQVLTNQQVVKAATDANGKVTWTIDINNMGAPMDEAATITDVLDSALTLDASSIKLYEGIHGTSGSAITGAAATPMDASTYTTKVSHAKDGSSTIQVTLPVGGYESYRLVYDTYLQEPGNYNNTAKYEVGSVSATSTFKVNVTSCSWANGTQMSLINVYLKDEVDGTTPIEGGKFAIYSEDTFNAVGGDAKKLTEDNADNYGWTDTKGRLTFLQEPGKYYIKALDDPEGGLYTLDTDATGQSFNKGLARVDRLAKRATSKTGKTNTLVLTNQFMNGVNDLTSSFKLYLDAGNGKTYGVELKQEADGSYSYVGLTDPDAPEQSHIGTTPSSVGVTGNTSSIEITGLPWGDYYFTEEKTAHGYVLEESKITATVENGKSAEATVTNNQTILYLKSESDEIVPTETYRITTAVGDDPVFKEIEITGEELQKGVLLQGMTNPNVRYYVVDKDGNEVSLTAKSSVTDEELDAAKPIVNKTEVPVPSFGQNSNRSGNTGTTGNAGATPSAGTTGSKAVAGSNHSATNGNGGGTRIEGDFVGKTVESENHKAKVSSAWVHKSPKTNDSWFGDLVEWILTK